MTKSKRKKSESLNSKNSNSQGTKRTLRASIFAVLICVVMLIGTTFAWFTDTASTAVDKIQAGTLDVALEVATAWDEITGEPTEWESAEGKTIEFIKAEEGAEQTILWEPGCTYKLPQLRVANNGNLALKYKVMISDVVGDTELNDVIDWTMTLDGTDYSVDDEHKLLGKTTENTDYDIFTISGHMDESAGNEYQNLSIEGVTITVLATQLTSEFDSISDQYDKYATYLNKDSEGNYLIGTAAELRYFAKTVNNYPANTNFKLTSDIDLGGANWTPIAWTVNHGGIFDGQNHTISNFKVNGQKNLGLFGDATGVTIKNLKVNNATVTGIGRVGAIVGQGICTKIDNCHVTNSAITAYVYNGDDGDKAGAIIGQLSAQTTASMTNCSVDNCTVKAYRDLGGLAGHIQDGGSTVTGNKVSNSTVIKDLSAGLVDKGTAGEIAGRQDEGFVLDTTTNTATDVAMTVIDSSNAIVTTGDNANIVIAKTAVVNASTNIGKGTTISGTGVDTTTVEVEKAKISTDGVTIKDMTINGSGASGTTGELGISGNNTTVENVVFNGEGTGGNIAVTVSTGKNNTGTTFRKTTITNAFRGIQFWSLSGDSLIEDCVLDVAGYTFNVDSVVAGATLTIKNTTLNGWTSYTSGIKKVSFVNCKLGLNTYEYLRPYSETEMTGCQFTSEGYKLNAGGTGTYTITLTDCTKNGTDITADNVKSLLLDTDGWNSNVTLIVNGTTVSVN